MRFEDPIVLTSHERIHKKKNKFKPQRKNRDNRNFVCETYPDKKRKKLTDEREVEPNGNILLED